MAQAKTLLDSEYAKVMKYVATQRHADRNRCVIAITHYAGLRIGEVALLRVSHVMNADGTVKNEIRFKAHEVKERRDGVVPVSDKLAKELAGYLQSIRVRSLDQPLFATQQSEAFSANTLTQRVNYIYKQAGIAGATSHSGRRTFITKLAEKGIGIRVLQKLARHQSIATTQVYIDCNDDMMRKAVGLL